MSALPTDAWRARPHVAAAALSGVRVASAAAMPVSRADTGLNTTIARVRVELRPAPAAAPRRVELAPAGPRRLARKRASHTLKAWPIIIMEAALVGAVYASPRVTVAIPWQKPRRLRRVNQTRTLGRRAARCPALARPKVARGRRVLKKGTIGAVMGIKDTRLRSGDGRTPARDAVRRAPPKRVPLRAFTGRAARAVTIRQLSWPVICG